MMSIALVTGASGFYGTRLCGRLLEGGWNVHGTGRNPGRALPGLANFHVADFSDLDAASRVLKSVKPDVVFHLAGSASAAPEVDLVLSTHHSQVTSALNLLSLAVRTSVSRIVLIGSLMEPVGDVTEIVPSSPYSAAKLSVMHYGRMFHRLFDAPVTIARPFMTFGPGQHDSHVLPYVIRSLMAGCAPKLTSGEWQTDWIYVDDVIDGLIRSGTHPAAVGQVIDFGRGELRSVREMVMTIAKFMGSNIDPEFGALESRPDEPIRTADVATTRRLLGWTPKVDIDEGLQRTIEWFQAGSSIG